MEAPFHYYGIKCEKCGTFNTKLIWLIFIHVPLYSFIKFNIESDISLAGSSKIPLKWKNRFRSSTLEATPTPTPFSSFCFSFTRFYHGPSSGLSFLLFRVWPGSFFTTFRPRGWGSFGRKSIPFWYITISISRVQSWTTFCGWSFDLFHWSFATSIYSTCQPCFSTV